MKEYAKNKAINMNSYEESGKLAVELGKTASVLKKSCPGLAENYEKMARAILRTMMKKSREYQNGTAGKELASAYINGFDDNLKAISRHIDFRGKSLDKWMKNTLEYCKEILG